MIFIHLKRGNPLASDTNLSLDGVVFGLNYTVATIFPQKVLDVKTGEELSKDQEVAVNQVVTLVPALSHGTNAMAVKRGIVDIIPSGEVLQTVGASWPSRLRAGQQLAFTGKMKKKMTVLELISQPLADIYIYGVG